MLIIRLPAIAAGNTVLYWNEQVLNATRLARNPPPIASLHFGTYHAAIFDAVNGITRTHRGWLVNDPAPAGASMDAAIASASFTVLNALWGQAANPRNFQVAYDQVLAAIPEGQAKADGLAWGKQVAEAILANRARSGWNKPREDGPFSSNEQGKWRETAPGFRPPVTPQVAITVPFVLKTPDQFRAPPPMRIDSKEYAEELAYVAKVGPRGGIRSSTAVNSPRRNGFERKSFIPAEKQRSRSPTIAEAVKATIHAGGRPWDNSWARIARVALTAFAGGTRSSRASIRSASTISG